MLINLDRTVTPLVALRSDLLLGVMPDTVREDHEILLERGATLILYTDGLIERRGQTLLKDLQRLQGVLEALATDDTDLDTLVDRLLTEMLPARPEDDVAVVAIRLHRQDRPRPVEAGPQRVPAHVAAEPTEIGS